MAIPTPIISDAIHSQSKKPDTNLMSGSKLRLIGKINFTR